MAITNHSITLRAHGPANLFDLAPDVSDFLAASSADDGRLFISSIGSTGAVIGLPGDGAAPTAFVDWVLRAIPFDPAHRHPGNAFAHLRSTVLKSDMSLPVKGKSVGGPQPFLLESTAGRKNRLIIMTLLSEGDDMVFERGELSVEGHGWIDIVDLTAGVTGIIAAAGLADGRVFVSAADERSAVVTIEDDTRLLMDTADFIDDLTRGAAKADRRTAGHIAAAVLGPSVSLPIARGRLEAGTWQQIMLVDLAEAGAKRIIVDVIGN